VTPLVSRIDVGQTPREKPARRWELVKPPCTQVAGAAGAPARPWLVVERAGYAGIEGYGGAASPDAFRCTDPALCVGVALPRGPGGRVARLPRGEG
jgi:hypothetical protein